MVHKPVNSECSRHSAVILTELAERAGRLYARSLADWLACARVLLEPREIAERGEWLKFLDHAGIPERTARNMVRLAKAGLQPQIISALGGVAETLDLLKTVAGWGNARVAALGGTERALLFAHAVRRSRLWAETCLEGAESATERGAIRQSWPDGPVSAARWLAFGNAVEDAQSEPERREAWELRPWARARLKNACNAPLVLNQYVGTFGGL